MKFLGSLALLVFSLVAVSCSPAPTARTIAVSMSDQSASARLFDDVNTWRASKGKKNVARHEGLDRLAYAHSEFLRQNKAKLFQSGGEHFLSHQNFGPRADIARLKYDMNTIHENVTAGPLGMSAVRNWERSPRHEAGMRDSWTHSGIGVVVDDDGTTFATQIFGSPAPKGVLQRRRGPF